MPSKNRIKVYVADSYYHIYNRGVNKRVIFKDTDDFAVFLNLLKRYLDREVSFDIKKRAYQNFYTDLDLLSFCLMPNHFHLLIYIHNETSMSQFMLAVTSSYTTYFNKRYKRRGPLFEDRYKASLISSEDYLMHISRYIHLNPKDWRRWEFSSLPYYLGSKQAEWIKPKLILELFEGVSYLDFAADYVDHKKELERIKYELANY